MAEPSDLFAEPGSRAEAGTVDPKKVLEEAVKDRIMVGEPIKLRQTKLFFRPVPDFARDEEGSPIRSSLKGPARIEAQEQWAREKLIAMEEFKMLRGEVERCYRREGVNHLENCKHLVRAYTQVLQLPHYGMLRVRCGFFECKK